VSNLDSPYLRKRYQASGTTDTITVTFSQDKTIDSLFWGYTNIKTMLVTFYNASDEIVQIVYFNEGDVGYYYGYGTEDLYGYDPDNYYGYYERLSDHAYDPVSWHFGQDVTFRYATFEIEADETAYLGAIGLGQAVEMPDPQAEWEEDWDDKSIVSYSQAGQVQSQYVEPMRVYDFSFDGISRDRMNALREVYKTYGIGHIIWVDPTERAPDFMTPMYASLLAWGKDKKDGLQYSFSITVKEAR